jgi:hypothetical protein
MVGLVHERFQVIEIGRSAIEHPFFVSVLR